MESPNFKTRDLPLATCLLYFGYILLEIDKTEYSRNGRFYFIYKQVENLPPMTNIVNLFISKQLQVEPFRFYQCYRDLQTAIHANRRNEDEPKSNN